MKQNVKNGNLDTTVLLTAFVSETIPLHVIIKLENVFVKLKIEEVKLLNIQGLNVKVYVLLDSTERSAIINAIAKIILHVILTLENAFAIGVG